jgi:hypothetical protein
MRWNYRLICKRIKETRMGRRESFAPLQGPGFLDTDEVRRAFLGHLARAKKKFGVTNEEWERWRKNYEEYLKEEIIDVQVLSVQGALALLKLYNYPHKGRLRDFEAIYHLSDLPAPNTPIETGNWFDASVRIDGNAITKWVSWKAGSPLPTKEEVKEFVKKHTYRLGPNLYVFQVQFSQPK